MASRPPPPVRIAFFADRLLVVHHVGLICSNVFNSKLSYSLFTCSTNAQNHMKEKHNKVNHTKSFYCRFSQLLITQAILLMGNIKSFTIYTIVCVIVVLSLSCDACSLILETAFADENAEVFEEAATSSIKCTSNPSSWLLSVFIKASLSRYQYQGISLFPLRWIGIVYGIIIYRSRCRRGGMMMTVQLIPIHCSFGSLAVRSSLLDILRRLN